MDRPSCRPDNEGEKKNTTSLKDTKVGATFGNAEERKDEIAQHNKYQQMEECSMYMLTRSQQKIQKILQVRRHSKQEKKEQNEDQK